MDFRPSEEQEILRRTVREFAEAEMRPHVMEWDEAQRFSPDLLPKLAALGLTGIQFDERYGGSGMSAVDYCICIEELARVDPAVALSVAAHNGLCTAHINLFGSEAQKTTYLPRLVKGEVLGAWGLTEAGAGSDAAAMRTTATRQGDCWVLSGAKTASSISSAVKTWPPAPAIACSQVSAYSVENASGSIVRRFCSSQVSSRSGLAVAGMKTG